MDIASGQSREGGEAVHVDSTERKKKRSKDEEGGVMTPHSRFHSASQYGLTGPGRTGSSVKSHTLLMS